MRPPVAGGECAPMEVRGIGTAVERVLASQLGEHAKERDRGNASSAVCKRVAAAEGGQVGQLSCGRSRG